MNLNSNDHPIDLYKDESSALIIFNGKIQIQEDMC